MTCIRQKLISFNLFRTNSNRYVTFHVDSLMKIANGRCLANDQQRQRKIKEKNRTNRTRGTDDRQDVHNFYSDMQLMDLL